MSLNLQTTTAIIDENGERRGVEKLLELRSQRVQVVIVSAVKAQDASQAALDYELSDPTPEEWNRMLMHSGAFKDWEDPAEDIYTWEDGDPIERDATS